MSAVVRFYDAAGKEGDPLALNSLPAELRDGFNASMYACSVRVARQNERQGTSSSKTRGEVSLTNKKPWRQKGTGRARAGTARSPLWRSGGVTFGPRPGVRCLSVNKKTHRRVMLELVALAAGEGRILCADFDCAGGAFEPKTSVARKMLNDLKLLNAGKITLFLSREDELNYRAFRNISSVNVVFFDQPDVLALSSSDQWLFLKKNMDRFESMVGQWS
ncbi:50S ribosomal protein L4 [Candidatus Dependentiae bacterium]